MPIRLRQTVLPQIYDGTDEKDKLFAPDAKKAEIVIDAWEKMASGKFEIAAASSENISFGDVTQVRGYYVELQPANATSALPAATLNVNGLGATPFNSGVAGKPAFALQNGGPFTSLVVANLDTAVVLKGRWAVWGT